MITVLQSASYDGNVLTGALVSAGVCFPDGDHCAGAGARLLHQRGAALMSVMPSAAAQGSQPVDASLAANNTGPRAVSGVNLPPYGHTMSASQQQLVGKRTGCLLLFAGADCVCGPRVWRLQAGGRRDCDVPARPAVVVLHHLRRQMPPALIAALVFGNYLMLLCGPSLRAAHTQHCSLTPRA